LSKAVTGVSLYLSFLPEVDEQDRCNPSIRMRDDAKANDAPEPTCPYVSLAPSELGKKRFLSLKVLAGLLTQLIGNNEKGR
jgi:hypothetical protein